MIRQGFRPALVAFDVDGTLIDDTVFVWQTLHDHFRTDAAARVRARDDFFAGRISYQRWFEHDIELLQAAGADRAGMIEAIADMRPMDGAHEALAALVEAGVILTVISGSLSFVLDHIFPEHPFSDVLINHIDFDARGAITAWRHTPFDMAHKAEGLRMLAARHGVPLSRCAFVGDHFNDVEAVQLAGLGVAFNAKAEDLVRAADVVVDSRDLRDILPHLLGGEAKAPRRPGGAALRGRRVLVTRADAQAGDLEDALVLRGAVPLRCPLIETVAPADPGPLDEALGALTRYDWLLLTSANTVGFVAARRGELPPGLRVAAVGPGTAAAARARGWCVDLVAEEHVGEGLLAALRAEGLAGKRFLLPRAAVAREVLPEGLRAAGARADVVVAYETRMPKTAPATLAALLAEGPLDAVLFTSPSTVRHLLRALDGQRLGSAALGYIGPVAAEAGRDSGLPVDFVAEPHTVPALVAALETWFIEHRSSSHT